MPFSESQKAKRKKFYHENLQKALSNRKENYTKNRAAVKASSSTYRKNKQRVNPNRDRAGSRRRFKQSYNADLKQSRALSRRSSKEFYGKDFEHARALSRKSSKELYEKDREQSRAASKSSSKKDYARHIAMRRLSKKFSYRRNPLSKLVYSKRLYAKKPSAKTRANKAYYAKRRNTLRALRRDKYALAEPLHARKEAIKRALQTNLLSNKDVRDQLVEAFKNEHPTSAQTMSSKVLKRTVCKIAATKLLDKVFQVRRKKAGYLLATCRSIKKMIIAKQSDFGEALHSIQPMFYDTAYRLWPKDQPLPVNYQGECVVAKEVTVDSG